jgi:hypothetical protein
VRVELPAPIDTVIAKALAVDRASRYASADAWQDDLHALYELARYEQMARGEEFSAVHAQAAPPPPIDPYDDRPENSVLETTRVARTNESPLAATVKTGTAPRPAAGRAAPPPESESPPTQDREVDALFEDDDDHSPTLPPPAGFDESADSEPSLVTTETRMPTAPPNDDDEPNTMTGAAAAPDFGPGGPPPPISTPPQNPAASSGRGEVPYVPLPPAVEASRAARGLEPPAPPQRPSASRRPQPVDDDEPEDRTEKVRLTPELIEKLRAMKQSGGTARIIPPAAAKDAYQEEDRPTRVEKAPTPDEIRKLTGGSSPTKTRNVRTRKG